MPEHQIRRRWIKLWTQETLYGTTKVELLPDERGTWFLMLCKAGDSPVPGTICIEPNLPYTNEQLSVMFNVPLELYLRTEVKLIEHCKIRKNGTGIIEIVNWEKYQGFDKSEYQNKYMRNYMRDRRNKSDVKTVVKSNTVKSNYNKTKDKTFVKSTDKTRQDIDKEEDSDISNTNRQGNTQITKKDINTSSNEQPQENIFTIYEKDLGGLIGPVIAQELIDMEKTYTFEWFREAVKEACLLNKRSLKYVKGILKRWKVDGFKVDNRRQQKIEKPREIKDSTIYLQEEAETFKDE